MLRLNLPTSDLKVAVREGKKLIFDDLRRRWVPLTPEEWVRQHFTRYLIEARGYPPARLANEVAIRLGRTSKRCDTIAYGAFLEPLLVVEYKSPAVEVSKAVFAQIVRYNMALRVPYLVVSNGITHFCCRIDYKASSYAFLPAIPAYREILAGMAP